MSSAFDFPSTPTSSFSEFVNGRYSRDRSSDKASCCDNDLFPKYRAFKICVLPVPFSPIITLILGDRSKTRLENAAKFLSSRRSIIFEPFCLCGFHLTTPHAWIPDIVLHQIRRPTRLCYTKRAAGVR